jgi:capsid protein
MAWTLAEGAKMTNSVLLSGIIQTIITESDVLDLLPFETVVGNGYLYNREATQPQAQMITVGDTVTESTGTRTQVTAALKIMVMDSDIDLFEKKTMSDVNDLEAILLAEAAKAMAYKFDDLFIYGSVATDAKQFDGLHVLVPAAMQVHMSGTATGAPLSLASLDRVIDSVKPGRPDALAMNKTLRRRIKQFYRSTATYSFEMTVGDDGKPIETYGGIRVVLDDFITMTETLSAGGIFNGFKTGGATTTLFAYKMGRTHVCGLQNGSIEQTSLGLLESKNAERWRLSWFCSMMLGSTLSLACVDGITDAVVVS